MPVALILFIAMPILEIALLLRVGSAIGWVTTLLIVVLTAFLGSAMLRHQGLATLNKARARMDSGEMPAQQLLEGVMIMIGGVLLLTPGFVTDAFGFACLIPFTRQWLAAKIASRAITGFAVGGVGPSVAGTRGPNAANSSTSSASGGFGQTTASESRQRGRSSDGDIIDGDFRRLDEE